MCPHEREAVCVRVSLTSPAQWLQLQNKHHIVMAHKTSTSPSSLPLFTAQGTPRNRHRPVSTVTHRDGFHRALGASGGFLRAVGAVGISGGEVVLCQSGEHQRTLCDLLACGAVGPEGGLCGLHHHQRAGLAVPNPGLRPWTFGETAGASSVQVADSHHGALLLEQHDHRWQRHGQLYYLHL